MELTEKALADSLGIPYEIKKFHTGNHMINYLVAGHGPPLVLIHGGNIGWGQWYVTIPYLAKEFRVFAVDLPGAGRSGLVDYRSINLESDFFEPIKNFMIEVVSERAHVVGNSIGGWIALMLSLNSSCVDRLILTDSLGFTSHTGLPPRIMSFYPLAKFLAKTILAPKRSNKNIEGFLRSIFYDKKFPLKQEFVEYFYETMKRSHTLLFLSALTTITGFKKEILIMNQLNLIPNETAIIWGKQSSVLPPKYSEENFKLIPHSKVFMIDNCDHMPFIEKSTEFNSILSDFINNK